MQLSIKPWAALSQRFSRESYVPRPSETLHTEKNFLGIHWTTQRTGESEPRPTSGPTSGPASGSTSGPTSPPTRAPTRAPTRSDFPVFSPSRTPHETSREGVHGRAHEWTVGVHLSCFHLFFSLTNYTQKNDWELMFGSLHKFHVIHCVSINYTWNAGVLSVIHGVGHCIEKFRGKDFSMLLHKIYVMRSRPLHKISLSELFNLCANFGGGCVL